MTSALPCPTRCGGLDVHKASIVVAAVEKEPPLVLRPHRLSVAAFLDWAVSHLTPRDAVVLEATTHAWPLFDPRPPRVASVTGAHPVLVKWITAARVTTDPRDTVQLARLLAAGLIPPGWVPPAEVRELRTLVAHRQRLIGQRTQNRKHVQAILHTHTLPAPAGKAFAPQQETWWQGLSLPAAEHLRVRQGLALLSSLEPLMAEVATERLQPSMRTPWAALVPFLVQLPGSGVIQALILLSAMGDRTRLPTAKQLGGSSGLGASIHASGQTQQTGGIPKQGRRAIRPALVEAAWGAVAHHPHWKAVFERLWTRMNKRKAIVAVARKLLVVIWPVLTEQGADRSAQVEAVARKLLLWGTAKGVARRLNGSRGIFGRRPLTHLG